MESYCTAVGARVLVFYPSGVFRATGKCIENVDIYLIEAGEQTYYVSSAMETPPMQQTVTRLKGRLVTRKASKFLLVTGTIVYSVEVKVCLIGLPDN